MKTLIQSVLVLSFLLAAIDVYPQLSTGRAPFNKAASHVNYGTFPLADIAYANDNSTSNNVSLPLPAGHPFTIIGSFTAPVFACSMVRGGDGNYYLLEASPALYLFDPGSGTCTLIGYITGMGGDQPNGISFNPVDNKYYLVSNSAFYSLDINTLEATLIGSFTPAISGIMIDLCFDATGTCYSYEVNITPGAANAYTIDINTAAVTTLGYLGYTPNFGQGMSYDYENGVIYLSAFNYDTFTGQLRTMDKTTGMTTLVYDWGDQIAPFACETSPLPPCPVDPPGNPNPPNNATNIPIDGTTLTWDNGAGTDAVEVWFGQTGSVIKVYDGAPITSWSTGALYYFTIYYWHIVCKNDTCATSGPSWSFRTEQNPNLLVVDFYPQSAQYWTGSTDGSTKTDGEINTVFPKVGWAVYYFGNIPPFYPIYDVHFHGYVNANNWPYWSATPMGSVNPVTADAAAINNQIQSGWDQGVAYIFQNESGSITNGWHTYVMGNSALSDLREAINSGQGWFSMGFVDRDFTATYYINFDGWSQTNPPYLELATCLSCSPNPPSNLTAEEIVNGYPKVLLNWQDNSTDESSFRIYRKYGYPDDPRQFEQIGVVSPNLTEYIDTTVIVDSTYSYGVTANNYLYSSLYSNFVTITIDPIPVELTSFSADVNDGSVVLNWMTATETNNRGFEVERKVSSKQKSVSSQWESVGFVEGNGTITSAHSYSYTDRNVTGGKYNYRLKQIDFDGSFKYSNVVEVTVNVPLKYSLEQNYPNPFNPSTQISFSLAQDSKVKLKVFDILGREVAVLINENMTSGNHKTVFNASVLPSGVYIYRIEANGSDGSNFTSVRKMVLTK